MVFYGKMFNVGLVLLSMHVFDIILLSN